jgi:hypothetical protein
MAFVGAHHPPDRVRAAEARSGAGWDQYHWLKPHSFPFALSSRKKDDPRSGGGDRGWKSLRFAAPK